jgi:sugar/nucleoside kinase (ribokinase family)
MSSSLPDQYLRFVIAGCLNEDYILPVSGLPQNGVLGGCLAYAGVGLSLWGGSAGMIARVGANYPVDRLDRFEQLGFNLEGVRVLEGEMDTRRFIAHQDEATYFDDNPMQYYVDRGLPFPQQLLGYKKQPLTKPDRTQPLQQSIQISDIPEIYLEAGSIHICPIDTLSHLILPSVFRQGRATTITLSPAPSYMKPTYWGEIPGLLSEITAFIVPEHQLRDLFQGRSADLWEMAEAIGGFGPEFVLIQTARSGIYLYDRDNQRRWEIPQYPSRIADPTGGRDAFAGGFLIGYREHYDPLEAALMGGVAASLVVEGSGVYYALDAMPGLRDARLASLRSLVREI